MPLSPEPSIKKRPRGRFRMFACWSLLAGMVWCGILATMIWRFGARDDAASSDCIIVSDPLHMKRAMLMAEGLDMETVSSPTPTTRYRSLHTRLGFLVREMYFFHHYLITGN